MSEVAKEEHKEALRVSRQGALKIMDSVHSFLAANPDRFVVATTGSLPTAVREVDNGYMLDNRFNEQMTFPDGKSAENFANRWNSNLTSDQRASVSVVPMSAHEYHSAVIAECESNMRFVDDLLARG